MTLALVLFGSGSVWVASNGHAAPAAPVAADAPLDSPITVTSRLSPDPSNVGDLLEYEVVAAFPRGFSVNIPSGLALAPLHVASIEESDTEATGEDLRKVFKLHLQSFAIGESKIPSFDLTYVTAEGHVETVTVPATTFTVESLLVNESNPVRRLEDPPISLTYPNQVAETVVYSVLATLVAASILIPLLLRLLRRKRLVPVAPPPPPHEVAHAALGRLEQSDLLAQGDAQEYYVQLTEIAKGYFEGRFGVLALDHTTEEIRQQILRNAKAVEPLSPDELVKFLQRCDLVKFARFEPDRDEADQALAEVRTMVDRTETARSSKPAAPTQPGSTETPSKPGPTDASTATEDA